MSALGKLLRTTAFQLTLAYLLIFILFAVSLLGYFALNTRRLITEQITRTVNTEIGRLREQYNEAGIRGLVLVLDLRSRRPGSSLYLVTTPTGEGLAGNVGSLEPGVLDHPGWLETSYRRIEAPDGVEHRALVQVVELPGGFRLLVGRDLEERERIYGIISNAGRWSFALVVVLGLAGGFFVSRRVLKRIDAMTDTANTIMAGDLGGRLPIAGTGDELDRLAGNVNAMLERIEALMRGLKEVTDNIAHDLKTPLTRMRNRCEQALRGEQGRDYRAALESTIAESDDLIRTFDALLMIARAESGQARGNMDEFDAAEIARDVGELYEPLAEQKGLVLKIDAPAPAGVRGNRELVSQALANLVDNAIKYAGPDASKINGAAAEILVKAGADGERITLSVADRGPGIPEADRGRVVERFVRLEQSRSEPGSGLGLSLASAVARLHGGELRLEDNRPGLRSIIALPRTGPAGT
ncbi:MAG TPA: HAMP domain-containing sensor histidine kinase [Xanthobacteraceae bacterium]|nr:HAMP domain-containing sensor histidine kinase [Xanthobacteraceae bacterium]